MVFGQTLSLAGWEVSLGLEVLRLGRRVAKLSSHTDSVSAESIDKVQCSSNLCTSLGIRFGLFYIVATFRAPKYSRKERDPRT